MSQIRALVTMTVSPDDRAKIEDVVGKLVAAAATEPGTLGMSYAMSADGATLYVNEHYTDIDGMLAHLHGMDPGVTAELGGLISIDSMVVFGPVNDQIKEIVAGFGNVSYADTIGEASRV